VEFRNQDNKVFFKKKFSTINEIGSTGGILEVQNHYDETGKR
jgi:hypothetical protein